MTDPTVTRSPLRGGHRSGRIRKRPSSWAIPCFMSLATFGNARIPQHRVRSPKRVVPYRHVLIEHAGKPFVEKFWIPSDNPYEVHSADDRDDFDSTFGRSLLRARSRESLRMTAGVARDATSALWYVHGDASLRSPEEWYRQRKQRRRPLQNRQNSESTNVGDDLHRRDQIVHKFAAATNTAGGDGGVNIIAPDVPVEEEDLDWVQWDDSSEPENETAPVWNVSSQVKYDQDSDGPNGSNATSSVVYTTTSSTDSSNASFSFQPIRIRAVLPEQNSGAKYLSDEEREILLQDILSPAILAWSAALRVDPVVGNLTVDQEQLFDGQTCGPGMDSGLPSVPVPPSHLKFGVPDTDLIVYLSLGFVDSPSASPSVAPSEAPSFYEVSAANVTEANITEANMTGAVNTSDPSLQWATNISASSLPDFRPTCSGDYLASATYCSTDQYDRPSAAMLHVCIDSGFFLERSLDRDILTIMHELGHVVGFNAQSLAHFRRSDGSPLTPRVNGDVLDVEVECTGPSPRRSETLPLPSEDILRFRMVRGVRVADVVTPSVKQVVRNHFNCHDLDGAELESGHVVSYNTSEAFGDEGSCIGDHLERRIFRMDLMNPLIDEIPFSLRISSVTLALLADSGWYQVDLSRTAFASSWGRGAGCGFVQETCITEDGRVSGKNEPFFCNDVVTESQIGTVDEIHGCSPDLSRKAACSMTQYDTDLPLEYQYFNRTYFGPSVGGSEPFLDFCPVYAGFSNGLCKDWRSRNLFRVSPIEQFGEKRSRCVTGSRKGAATGFCLPIACVMKDRSLLVKVSGVWKKCEYSGQELIGSTMDESVVVCPDPVRACPTFYCQRDCLGTGGICDYKSGECVCTDESRKKANETGSLTLNKGANATGTSSHAENSTKFSLEVICEKLSNESLIVEEHFYLSDLMEARSPLADPILSEYYVTTVEALERKEADFPKWAILVILVAGCVLIIFGLVLCFVLKILRQASTARDSQSGTDDEVVSSNPNKDKFVASLLVDMRIHNPQDTTVVDNNFVETISETEGSLTETDGSEHATSSSLNISHDSGSCRSNDSDAPSDVSPFQLPIGDMVKSVMRRRNV